MTSDGIYTYQWNMLNRLRRVKQGWTVLGEYWYDAEGRRVAKKVGSTTTYYALDGWREIEEYEGSTLKRQFVYGSFIDEPLVMDVNLDSDGTAYMMSGTVDGADASLVEPGHARLSVRRQCQLLGSRGARVTTRPKRSAANSNGNTPTRCFSSANSSTKRKPGITAPAHRNQLSTAAPPAHGRLGCDCIDGSDHGKAFSSPFTISNGINMIKTD